MKKIYKINILLSVMLLFSTITAFAQSTVKGIIKDAETNETLIGVSVSVKGKVIGTITDIDGSFELTSNTPVPYQVSISYIGYQNQTVDINDTNATINISLKDQAIQGQEIIVSASRVEESILQSPAAIEKMDLRDIQQNSSTNFYDGIIGKKGIDMTTQGLLFKSINMRGFGSTGNVRSVQMIDGMDNQAPGLNFPVDNIVGMSELDVESVDILPGASSALYGPNAINGLILMNSKSPFLYQGFSANLKGGAMIANNRETTTTPYYDVAVRYAKAINNKLAYKVNLSYIGAQDWEATDNLNLNSDNSGNFPAGLENGTRGAGVNTDYDGQNIYGDEVQANMQTVANGMVAAGLLSPEAAALVPNSNVSRTGYNERDLIDYNTKSFKASAAMHYRVTEKMELIGQFNYGSGTTAYTGTGRYSIRNFNISQAKLELRGDNFKLRAYTTQERSGESYVSGLVAVQMLNEIKPHATWFGEYTGAYLGALAQGASSDNAHLAARGIADANMPEAGSTEYNTMFNKYKNLPIAEGGGAFRDKSNLYHIEGVYDFKNEIEWAEVLVGGNLRQYQLRSAGTLFADQVEGRNGKIKINEYGVFTQVAKSMFNNHFKLSGSIRYDKNENFDGQFTPRVSGVYSFKNQNLRLSYQTGFRIPTTQNQYIHLATPSGTLLGGIPEFVDRHNLESGIATTVLAEFTQNGLDSKYLTAAAKTAAISNATNYAIAAVQSQVTAAVTAQVTAAVAAGQIPEEQAAAAITAAVTEQMNSDAVKASITQVATQVTPAYLLAELPKYKAKKFKPEKVYTYEIGYKGLISKKLFIDAYYYNSVYKDFIGDASIVVPTKPAATGLPIESGVTSATTRAAYSRPINVEEDITIHGWALGLDYSIKNNFYVGSNVAFNKVKDFTPSVDLQTLGFNTPEYRYNLSFGKKIGSRDKIGFNINFRHQDNFVWEASMNEGTTAGLSFYDRTVVPAINNLDAQISFKAPQIKSIIKIGGTNIGGNPYIQAYGSPSVGSMYYVSISYDAQMNK